MALTLKMSEGDDFYIDDTRVYVESIHRYNYFSVMVEQTWFNRYWINDAKATEIMPKVLLSAGKDTDGENRVKVVIEAPPEVTILRGRLYREQNGQN